jgi:hypothetical protein
MAKAFTTNYRQAWLAYRKTDDYKTCWEAMKAKGFKQYYATNIMKLSFAAGWGDREIIEIK